MESYVGTGAWLSCGREGNNGEALHTESGGGGIKYLETWPSEQHGAGRERGKLVIGGAEEEKEPEGSTAACGCLSGDEGSTTRTEEVYPRSQIWSRDGGRKGQQ